MNKIEVCNIFAAVFEKSVLDELLEVLGKGDEVDPRTSSTRINLVRGASSGSTRGRSSMHRFWGTEGTIKYVKSNGFLGTSVVQGFDYDGRVKSLDRANFVRILADTSKKKHLDQLKKEKLEPIDLVVVDLYAPDPKIFPESMDIGGQSLIRSAIKNYKNIALAWDKKSVGELVSQLKANQGSTLLSFRKAQARKAAKFIAQRTKLEAEMFDKLIKR